jgi:hypothetical protein
MGGACLVIPTSRLPNGVDEASKVVLHPVVLLNAILQVVAAAIDVKGHIFAQDNPIRAVDDDACSM